ncbi:MAG TPA: DUF4124 domain-containing protein [Rhodanobacteraceae bacterium]|nr:DUF4124 domain-containing protein [Rhodanobacteraceae bacterium]
MRIRFVAALPLLLAVCAVAQGGDFYKWTDTQGTVHYTQTPPPGRVSKPIYVNDGAPTPPLPGMNGTPATPGQKAKAKTNQVAVQNANREAIAANCKAAQQNISDLQGRRPMVKAGGDPAGAHALDPDARKQALDDAQKQAAIYCTHQP